MKYIILTFILGLIVFVSVKGCFYPTSYRAFIPKSLDSEYKEFERLCKEEVGKVVYARPIKHGIKLEDLFNLPSTSARRVALSRHMYMLIENVTTREDEIFYLHIAGFEYYTG
ncbi:hypothetical protein PJP90_001994, partial [Campylobacter coli]|nr:hypothetical protein [Campylobacter coli]